MLSRDKEKTLTNRSKKHNTEEFHNKIIFQISIVS